MIMQEFLRRDILQERLMNIVTYKIGMQARDNDTVGRQVMGGYGREISTFYIPLCPCNHGHCIQSFPQPFVSELRPLM